MPAADVAKAAGKVVEPILPGIVFHHNFGYPVGIGYPGTWIEFLGFFLRVDNPRPLEAGMVFHLPMSFRKFGEFGVNQSHTIRIRADGPAEALTKTEARLKVLAGSVAARDVHVRARGRATTSRSRSSCRASEPSMRARASTASGSPTSASGATPGSRWACSRPRRRASSLRPPSPTPTSATRR